MAYTSRKIKDLAHVINLDKGVDNYRVYKYDYHHAMKRMVTIRFASRKNGHIVSAVVDEIIEFVGNSARDNESEERNQRDGEITPSLILLLPGNGKKTKMRIIMTTDVREGIQGQHDRSIPHEIHRSSNPTGRILLK